MGIREYSFTIKDSSGKDSFHLINTIACTNYQLTNETFLIPLDYVQRKRFYYEKENSSYARGCWYDAFLAEDLNIEWLTENCEITKSRYFTKEYLCDKGFTVIYK